ncbi:hypothetical protein FA95DRAFT_1314811 [Auriscalpium vulgare]|uniref:Uncharacterized protein n=1 Tax=Auriscalpium vulgare TaxID=40419 RepID=A0ACB8S8Z3_9AGAM|nr:hypothetical protein FA95DRAFT_1314811 [Auriscalpium vulgare]
MPRPQVGRKLADIFNANKAKSTSKSRPPPPVPTPPSVARPGPSFASTSSTSARGTSPVLANLTASSAQTTPEPPDEVQAVKGKAKAKPTSHKTAKANGKSGKDVNKRKAAAPTPTSTKNPARGLSPILEYAEYEVEPATTPASTARKPPSPAESKACASAILSWDESDDGGVAIQTVAAMSGGDQDEQSKTKAKAKSAPTAKKRARPAVVDAGADNGTHADSAPRNRPRTASNTKDTRVQDDLPPKTQPPIRFKLTATPKKRVLPATADGDFSTASKPATKSRKRLKLDDDDKRPARKRARGLTLVEDAVADEGDNGRQKGKPVSNKRTRLVAHDEEGGDADEVVAKRRRRSPEAEDLKHADMPASKAHVTKGKENASSKAREAAQLSGADEDAAPEEPKTKSKPATRSHSKPPPKPASRSKSSKTMSKPASEFKPAHKSKPVSKSKARGPPPDVLQRIAHLALVHVGDEDDDDEIDFLS